MSNDIKKPETGSEMIFDAIRADDLEQVKTVLRENPAAINAIAPKRPLDTRGMSPLQVSLCTGRHKKIAWFLLENGADVNYIPDRKLADMRVLLGRRKQTSDGVKSSSKCKKYNKIQS